MHLFFSLNQPYPGFMWLSIKMISSSESPFAKQLLSVKISYNVLNDQNSLIGRAIDLRFKVPWLDLGFN